MRSFTAAIACAVAMATSLAAPPSHADRDGPNFVEKPAAAAPADFGVARLNLARDVVTEAVRAGDPVMALAAARLAAGVEVDGPSPTEPERIIALARDIVAETPELLAAMDALTDLETRGVVSGVPVRRSGVVAPGETLTIDEASVFVFRERQRAEIYLVGRGASDLDLLVRDELGHEICRAEGPTDRERCSWTPLWEGPFVIEVRNRGVRENTYEIITN